MTVAGHEQGSGPEPPSPRAMQYARARARGDLDTMARVMAETFGQDPADVMELMQDTARRVNGDGGPR